ncbi:guanine nucleotide exchange protein SMCR8 [Patella vulgata]|uniref:guanine nucleotide exchange protein SMCR8 n=1 Tax=Patella vulgata TaxID=6465 RepID=UPI0021800308|nr:guanine nucleotide exchange protein SMCR8 [Patella vulgata]
MFGEYAQVASYFGQTEAVEGDGNMSYPPSYLLPTFNAANPWRNEQNSKYGTHEDFIIIAEFSEIEGPKPLLTIPSDGGHGFDHNAFSVKIMAVDHQTSTTGFSISEDTQVILTDSGEFQVCAFVHHFALYDHEARGFVRPFCMAYVTKEERKLVNFYEEFSSQFRKVAQFFKYGNRMCFVKDLERYSKDLEYTKGVLIGRFNKPMPEQGCTEEAIYKDLQHIQSSLAEIRDILDILRPLLNDKRLESRFHTLESRAWRESNKKDKLDSLSLQEQWFTEHGDQPASKYGSFNDAPDNPLHLFEKIHAYSPKLVEMKKKKKFDRTLRGLHELCSWGAKEGMKKMRWIYEHFKREAMILELEREETSLLDPSTSVLSCGQCITHNFLSGLSLRPADCPALSFPAELLQKWSSIDTLEGSVGSFKSVVSESSLTSAQSNDSFMLASEGFCDDDTLFTPPFDVDKTSPSVVRADSNLSGSSSMTESDTMPSVYESCSNSPMKTPDKTINEGITLDNVETSSLEYTSDLQDNNSVITTESGITITTCNSESQNTSESDSKLTDSSVDSTPDTGQMINGVYIDPPSSDENLLRQYSEPDDTTDTTPSSEGTRLIRKPRGGIYTVGDLLFNLRYDSSGIGVLQVLNKYNNIQHIIYSILTGRLVLVVGQAKHEMEVIKLVTALCLFLPNHRRKHHAIVEWSSKPFRLTDLPRIKIAGVCRTEKRSIESVVKKYCSIIDVDKKVIIAPTYQGTLIHSIISKKKCFKTDADFIAFTHCWFMEIAAKAFIFYHSFCLGSTNIISHHSSVACHKQQYCNSVKGFITKLGIHEGDSPIIEYFAEIIKLLQIDQTSLPIDEGFKVSPVTLSYQSCQMFRC